MARDIAKSLCKRHFCKTGFRKNKKLVFSQCVLATRLKLLANMERKNAQKPPFLAYGNKHEKSLTNVSYNRKGEPTPRHHAKSTPQKAT